MTIIVSFVLFLLSFVAIGIYSATRKKNTAEDYLLSGRDVNPWLMALSTMSTNNSGFMFIGMIGATYAFGISSMWIMVGWIVGDFIAWTFVHKQLRVISEERKIVTIPGFLGMTKTGSNRLIVIMAAVITFVALSVYAAAQLKAGSKALHVLLGWDDSAGAIMGALIVFAYSFSGGLRASIWTDAVQTFVMIGAMLMLLGVTLYHIGGIGPLWEALRAEDANLVNWMPQKLMLGFGLYLMGWLFAGIGVSGQPHIMIRAMTLKSVDGVKQARNIYFLSYVFFTVMVILVGLCARILLPDTATFDKELALPTIAQQFLPEILVGMFLAGLFAATISTADSQVLSCSAAVSQDIITRGNPYIKAKAATLAITVVTLLIALYGSDSVFDLVTGAWAMLACSLAPLMIVQVMRWPVSQWQGLIMMIGGLATMQIWTRVELFADYKGSMYAALPGIVVGFLLYVITKPIFKDKAEVAIPKD